MLPLQGRPPRQLCRPAPPPQLEGRLTCPGRGREAVGGGGAAPGAGAGRAGAPHLRNIRQALQLVVLSNVYIWKLWWLALALSGLMFDLAGGGGTPRVP